MVSIPTKQNCMHLLKLTYRVPQNIIDHSIQVNKVAVFLALKLNEKNINVDVDLVDRASILHDVLKVIEIHNLFGLINPENNEPLVVSKKDRLIWLDLKNKYGHLTHEEAAYEVFKEKYPEMAEIIRKHGYINIEDNQLKTWEEKIVHYADKRVKHSKIVLMEDRLQEGHKRYHEKNKLKGIDEEFQNKVDKKLFELEKEIFNKLDFSPDELMNLLND